MRPLSLCTKWRSATNTVPSVLYFAIGLLIAVTVWAHAGFLHSKSGHITSTSSYQFSAVSVGQYAQMGMDLGTIENSDEANQPAEDEFDENAAYEAAFAEEYEEDEDLEDLQIFVPEDNAVVQGASDNVVTDTTAPDEVEYVERPEEQLLIVEVVVDEDSILDAGIIIYVDDESRLWLPLGVLTELMQFPIDVNPGTGEANGWFIAEENSFVLKPPYRQMTYKGEQIEIVTGSVENHFDDIFVSEAFFENVFPVTADLSFNDLRLYLEAEEDLPFQVLAKRRAKWQQASRQSNQPGRYLEGDIIRLPYRKYSFPSVQVTHSLNALSMSGAFQNNSTTSVQSQGDFLGMNLRVNGSFTTNSETFNEFSSLNVTFEKEDYQSKMLGPLQASQFELGDVSGNGLTLANNFQRGRGFAVTNAPLNFVRSPNDFTVEGFGPVDWDVEVYQDGRLLEFDTIDADGRYEFDALPLRRGFNQFQIVLYGPNGEREERYERFYLGQNMVDKGEFIYDVTLLESSTPLIDPRRDPTDKTSGTVSFQGDYGISENFSVNGGFYQGPIGSTMIRGAGAGVRGTVGSTYAQFNMFQTDDSARSFNFEATGNITKDLYWNAGQVIHNGYEPGVRTTERDTFASLSKQFSLKLIPQGNISFGVRDQKFDSGQTTRTYSNTLSGQIFETNFTNDIEYEVQENADPQITGSLTARRRIPLGNFRARLNYGLKNPAEFTSADLQLQSRLNDRFTFNGLLSSNFIGDRETTLQAGIDVKFDKFRLGVSGSASTEENYRAGLTLSYNFIPQSLQGNYKMTGDTSDLNTGVLLVRPYLDENQNDMYDDGEKVIEGLEFRNLLSGKRGTVDESGVATLQGLTPAVVNRVRVEPESYPDIYLVADKEEVNVYGKRGIGGPIDFALNKLGEISGSIYVSDPATGGMEGLAGVVLYLLDENGDVYQESYSEFDGFYSFTSVPVGTYRIYFPKSQALVQVTGGRTMTSEPFQLSYDAIEIFDGDFEVSPMGIEPLGDTITGDMLISGTNGGGSNAQSAMVLAQKPAFQPRAPLINGFYSLIFSRVESN